MYWLLNLKETQFCNRILTTFFHTLPFYLSLSSVFLLLSPSTCNEQEKKENTIMSSTHFPVTSFSSILRSLHLDILHHGVTVVRRYLLSFHLYQNGHISQALYLSVSVSLSLSLPLKNLLHYSNVLQTFIHECTESKREKAEENRIRISGRSQEVKMW